MKEIINFLDSIYVKFGIFGILLLIVGYHYYEDFEDKKQGRIEHYRDVEIKRKQYEKDKENSRQAKMREVELISDLTETVITLKVKVIQDEKTLKRVEEKADENRIKIENLRRYGGSGKNY